ncbi:MULTISPECIES: hypothetical protein [Polaromonas]|uniref:Glycine zipper 2TM domain-containing protein n=1 Tax=Polaromonas aquatica TaxID=332657 RepID=A0ABW1TZ58_9BURK
MEAKNKVRMSDVVINVLGVISLVMVFGFAPGARAQSGNVYGGNQVQTMSTTEEGVVLQVSIKKAEASWQARTGGATGGGLVGALLGNSLGGGNYQAKALLGALGAMGGGFAGERIANAVSASDAQEIVIGLRDPRSSSGIRVVTVVQPAPFDAVAPNDNVLLVNTNGAIRVLRRTYNTAYVQR